MLKQIIKRDSRKVLYDKSKISDAILMAATQVNEDVKENIALSEKIADAVETKLSKSFNARRCPTVEQIQDFVEEALIDSGYPAVAKEYILYRAERNKAREMKAGYMAAMEELTFVKARDSDLKRENGNIDSNTAMGTMLKYGSEIAKEFNHLNLLDFDVSEAHKNGDIHIHDLDFYALTTTCTQIPLNKLFKGGFNTGHGYLREPGSIRSAAALTAIALQSNQNEQHGGQSIPALDYYLAPYVSKSYVKHIAGLLQDRFDMSEETVKSVKAELKECLANLNYHLISDEGNAKVSEILGKYDVSAENAKIIIDKSVKHTDEETYQAMEALVHNLNSMHSRAGAQVSNVA